MASALAVAVGVVLVTGGAPVAPAHAETVEARPAATLPVVDVGRDVTSAATGGSRSGGVVVTIPVGAIMLTTPYTSRRSIELGRAECRRLGSPYAAVVRLDDIVVTDTRAGNLGFTATVTAGRFVSATGASFAGSRAGIVGVTAVQVPGNALRAHDVRVADTAPGAPGLGAPRLVARYPAGLSTGTVRVRGLLAVARVPSWVPAGRYTATLTVTAM